MRSRAVSLPPWCCFSIRWGPPPLSAASYSERRVSIFCWRDMIAFPGKRVLASGFQRFEKGVENQEPEGKQELYID